MKALLCGILPFFATLVLALTACQSDRPLKPELSKESKPPNILWIVCEDMGQMIAAFGDSTVQTPNLSRLAARGVRFPNTFSVAGVCAPSRFAIATGLYPVSAGAHHMRTQYDVEMLHQVGLPGAYGALVPPDVKMMSQVLREHGYFCSNNAKEDYQFEAPKTAWDEQGNKAHWRHRPKGQPFFSIFNLEATHESQVWATRSAVLRFREGFESDTSTIDRLQGWREGDDRPPLTVAANTDLPIPPYLPDTEVVRNDLRRVYSNIAIMDRQVGVLLDQLEEDGLLDNTVVFWYSDHGGPLPRQKRLLYDSGLRVPMIVAWPGNHRAGEVDSSLFSFVDLAPSVFSIAGIEPPDWLQGQANFGTFAATPREYVFGASDRLDEHYDRIRAARDQRFKYLRNYYPDRGYYLPLAYREQMPSMQVLLQQRDKGSLTDAQAQWFRDRKPAEELFDTWNDPHELENLAGRPAYRHKLEELRGATDAWLARVGDLGGEPEVEMVQRFWNGGDEMPVTDPPEIVFDSTGHSRINSKTPGAQIAYRVLPQDADRSGWRVYTGPFKVHSGNVDSVRAVAHRIGFRESFTSVALR